MQGYRRVFPRPPLLRAALPEGYAAVEKPLFLRSFGVPFWALARVFGKDPMYWYRLEISLGRNRIVGTTLRQVSVPKHLLADEHYQTLQGEKVYVATTVAEGCCLGAALSRTADEKGLTAAYATFQQEAVHVEPDYQPQTVNADGWAATRAAWRTLFGLIVVLRCFLHGWLNIRDRSKHLQEVFKTVGDKVWNAYRAGNRRSMAQRLRRLRAWAQAKLTCSSPLPCRRCRSDSTRFVCDRPPQREPQDPRR